MCEEIFELNIHNFRRRKNRKGLHSFAYECRKCHKKTSFKDREIFVKSKRFTCQRCGLKDKRSEFFDVDHIKPIRSAKRGFKSKWKDKSNLQLLCPNCHRNKTLEDLIECFNGSYNRKFKPLYCQAEGRAS